MPFLGESACLTAALMWAVAVVVFRGPIAAWGARTTNLIKCLVATLLLALTLPFFGGPFAFASVPARDLVFIAVSGVVGLSLGDTALFAAVARIGAHRTLVLQTTAPLFAGLLAAAAGERLAAHELAGGAVILGGVVMVVANRDVNGNGATGVAAGGVVLALLGAFGQGAGVVLAKEGLDSIGTVPATLLRLGAGSLGLFAAVVFSNGTGRLRRALVDGPRMRLMVPATFVGTYLALLLMMTGVSLAPATIAAVLLATSPIFSLVIEAAVDRKRPTALAVVGTLVAVVGVAMLVSKG